MNFTLDLLKKDKYNWLKKSDLYKSLIENSSDEENSTIINETLDLKFCSKFTNNIKEFLEVSKFWMVTYYPKKFFDILHENPIESIKYLIEIYEETKDDFYNILIKSLKINILEVSKFICSIPQGKFIQKRMDYLIWTYELDEKYSSMYSNKFWKDYACNLLAKYNNLEGLKYLVNKGYKVDKISFEIAIQYGNFEIFKYLRNTLKNIKSNICKLASYYGHLNILKYAYEHKYKFGEYSLYNAARNGHLECLKYIHKNGGICAPLTVYMAVKNGHLNCVKYLYENGFYFSNDICSTAALYGTLDILIYLKEKGFLCDSITLYNAVLNGNLEIIKYLKEHNFDPTTLTRELHKSACIRASKTRNLDILKYLDENGCPFSNAISIYVLINGNLDVLKYLYEKGAWYREGFRPGVICNGKNWRSIEYVMERNEEKYLLNNY